jgi:hypothetical protein
VTRQIFIRLLTSGAEGSMCFQEQKLAVSARKKQIQTPGVFD